jgi:hypothetical protein
MEKLSMNLTAILKTAMKVLTSPPSFFKEMSKTGGFLEPLIFMVVMGVIGGLVQTIFSFFSLHIAGGMAMGIASIIFVPILIAIFGFLGAAILFVIWKLFGSQESYETAYRCGAYISVLTPIATLLGLIPYIGSAIAIMLSIYFLVIASIEVHKIPSQKAWLVFGIIGVILIIINIGGQYSARRLTSHADQYRKQMEKMSEDMKKQAEEMQKQAEEARKATKKMQR